MMVKYARLYELYILHVSIVLIFLSACGALVWIGADVSEWQYPRVVVFLVSGIGFFLVFKSHHRHYEGYGVAQEINERLGYEKLLPVYSRAWKGFTVRYLVTYWDGALWAILGGYLLIRILEIEFPLFSHLRFPVIVGCYFGLLCAVYVWFAIDRKRYWYLSLTTFRSIITHVPRYRHNVEELEKALLADGLLLDDRFE